MRFFNNQHFYRHICRNKFEAELVEQSTIKRLF